MVKDPRRSEGADRGSRSAKLDEDLVGEAVPGPLPNAVRPLCGNGDRAEGPADAAEPDLPAPPLLAQNLDGVTSKRVERLGDHQ